MGLIVGAGLAGCVVLLLFKMKKISFHFGRQLGEEGGSISSSLRLRNQIQEDEEIYGDDAL